MLSQPHPGASRYLDEGVISGKPPYDGEPVRLGGGADSYDDFDGFDKVYGGGGDDSIHGYTGDDKLKGGGGGDDRLDGDNGNDFLIGGAGDDFLSGSKNRDYLYGGGGSDSFDANGNDRVIYHDVSESLPGATHDVYRFFNPDDDVRIDLRRIDVDTLTPENDAFHWIGKDAFSGTAGELRYGPTTDGVLLQGDVNGDAVADFEVYFLSFAPLRLVADDFKL